MNSYEIVVNGGRKPDPNRDGKITWPDCVSIYIPRNRAFDLIESLVRQLKDSNKEEFEYSFCGEVKKNKEDSGE